MTTRKMPSLRLLSHRVRRCSGADRLRSRKGTILTPGGRTPGWVGVAVQLGDFFCECLRGWHREFSPFCSRTMPSTTSGLSMSLAVLFLDGGGSGPGCSDAGRRGRWGRRWGRTRRWGWRGGRHDLPIWPRRILGPWTTVAMSLTRIGPSLGLNDRSADVLDAGEEAHPRTLICCSPSSMKLPPPLTLLFAICCSTWAMVRP